MNASKNQLNNLVNEIKNKNLVPDSVSKEIVITIELGYKTVVVLTYIKESEYPINGVFYHASNKIFLTEDNCFEFNKLVDSKLLNS